MTYAFLSFIAVGFFFLGWIVEHIRPKKPDGLLNVDVRDEKKDYYDFVFLIPTGDIPKRKNLTIEVHVKE